MAYSLSPEEYKRQFAEMINEWRPRLDALKNSYKMLSLFDELGEYQKAIAKPSERLETFVSNDPRVMHNMALFLLTPQEVPYNIPSQGYDTVIQEMITKVENQIRRQWNILDRKSIRSSNGGPWLHYFNNLMLATGWYAVFAMALEDNFFADIWSPAETFPTFDQDGLSEVLNFYVISASRARKKIAENNWPVSITSNAPVEVYNYWCYDDEGLPHNCVIMANQIAIEHSYHQLSEIPVLISGVNGLPDRGAIAREIGGDAIDWHATIGQSFGAVNEGVFRAVNRQRSFMQQILRDTAQPKIVERSKGKGVVTTDNWNSRGAIYKLDVDEDVSTVSMPGMPPEMSLVVQDEMGMIQRGGFDYSLFQGGQSSGYAQALTSSSAQQTLLAFKLARDFVIAEVSNIWLQCVRNGLARFPDGFTLPPSFTEEMKFEADIKINVPGDLIQRATTARTLNPNFSLSTQTTIDMTMPEIVDPNGEIVRNRVDRAMLDPSFAVIDTIEALLSTAESLEADGQFRHAQRYRSHAMKMEQELAQKPTSPNAASQALPPGLPGNANAGQ